MLRSTEMASDIDHELLDLPIRQFFIDGVSLADLSAKLAQHIDTAVV